MDHQEIEGTLIKVDVMPDFIIFWRLGLSNRQAIHEDCLAQHKILCQALELILNAHSIKIVFFRKRYAIEHEIEPVYSCIDIKTV